MHNVFTLLFKYKEKPGKDRLGYYPEKVSVKAFPERRYLWTSRFLVILSCISFCISMILASVLIWMVKSRTISIVPLQIDYQLYEITRMRPFTTRVYAGNLVVESLLADYVKARYTINTDNDYSLEELRKRTGVGEYLQLSSNDEVYSYFTSNELPFYEMLQQRGVSRKVIIDRVYPVSFDFWQVRFHTIDEAPDLSAEDFIELMGINLATIKQVPKQGKPLISKWIATIRMQFDLKKYKDEKELGLKNPFGLTITSYDLSYMGNNLKSKRY